MNFEKLDQDKELSDIVKEAVKNAFDKVESKYELYTVKLEAVESRSRDGFISSNDGGWDATGFISIGSITGSGRQSTLPQEVQDKITYFENNNLADALEQFKLENKLKIEELAITEENLNYSDLTDMGQEDLAEKLSNLESEHNSGSESELMFNVRSFFSKDIENGVRTMHVSVAVNWEAPYFRSGKSNEWVKEETIECSDAESLKTNLTTALASLVGNLA